MDRRSFFAGVLAVAVVRADRVMDDRKEFLRRSPAGCDEAHHRKVEAAYAMVGESMFRCADCGAVYLGGRWIKIRDLTKARASVIV